MATYQPKNNTLRELGGVWLVEAALMDHIDEAYYLGGDFDGEREQIFHYMVWQDKGLGRWFAGYNPYGQRKVPFSSSRCDLIGTYAGLREALEVCEAHAVIRVNRGASTRTLTGPSTVVNTFTGPVYA